MKTVLKYVLIGLGAALLNFLWSSLFFYFLNGSTKEVAVTVGTGMFLSFEMAVLTGVLLSKRK